MCKAKNECFLETVLNSGNLKYVQQNKQEFLQFVNVYFQRELLIPRYLNHQRTGFFYKEN